MTNEVTGARPAGSDDRRLDLLRDATRRGRVWTVRTCGAVIVLAGVAAAVGMALQGLGAGGLPQLVWSVLAVLFLIGSGFTARTLLRYPTADDQRDDRVERVRKVVVQATPWPFVLAIAILVGLSLRAGGVPVLVSWLPAAFVAVWVPGVASLVVPERLRDCDDGPLVAPFLAPEAGRRLARSARGGQRVVLALAAVLVAVVVTAVMSLRAPGGSFGWIGLVVAGALVQSVALVRTARAAGALRRADGEHVDRDTVHAGLRGARVTVGVAAIGAVLVVAGASAVTEVLGGAWAMLEPGIPRFGPILAVAFAPVWLATWLPDRVRVLTGITRRGRPPEQAGRSEARQDTRAE